MRAFALDCTVGESNGNGGCGTRGVMRSSRAGSGGGGDDVSAIPMSPSNSGCANIVRAVNCGDVGIEGAADAGRDGGRDDGRDGGSDIDEERAVDGKEGG